MSRPDPTVEPHLPPPDETRDLGFGAVVARESGRRLLNPDGSFNVERRGLGFWASLSFYHTLLTMSWGRFLLVTTAAYLIVNSVFAAGYLLCGPTALSPPASSLPAQFAQAFFFSVHTFATIGYGNITPTGTAANLLVVLESLVGLLGVALATGLVFARFSRPTAQILFSRSALIAPYRGISAFEFRIANARRNELVELEARVMLAYFEEVEGRRIRRFHNLTLERERVVFFPLAWTIVHPIDGDSPMAHLTHADLVEREAEFLVLLTGLDDTFSQVVHARSSYRVEDVIWGARFADIFERTGGTSGPLAVNIARLSDYEKVTDPTRLPSSGGDGDGRNAPAVSSVRRAGRWGGR